mmetsp:Transcript_4430/g.9827  ORF Transcript_4430/g.9827 Transcript_4430/m.9827 type:complete len:109 (+) Transcript_4430:627-953(+)
MREEEEIYQANNQSRRMDQRQRDESIMRCRSTTMGGRGSRRRTFVWRGGFLPDVCRLLGGLRTPWFVIFIDVVLCNCLFKSAFCLYGICNRSEIMKLPQPRFNQFYSS